MEGDKKDKSRNKTENLKIIEKLMKLSFLKSKTIDRFLASQLRRKTK